MNSKTINQKFIKACRAGDLEKAKYFVGLGANIHCQHDRAFQYACQSGHLEIIRYLLVSPELSTHVPINEAHHGFQHACLEKHFSIIKYLMTSDELKEKADINAFDGLALKWTCMHALETLQFLLTDEELKNKVDLHTNDDKVLKDLCMVNHDEHKEALTYLIVDYKINITSSFKKWLNESDGDLKDFALNLIKKMDFHEKINELIETKNHSQSIKNKI